MEVGHYEEYRVSELLQDICKIFKGVIIVHLQRQKLTCNHQSLNVTKLPCFELNLHTLQQMFNL